MVGFLELRWPLLGSKAQNKSKNWEEDYINYASSQKKVARYLKRLSCFTFDKSEEQNYILDLFCGTGENTQALKSLNCQNVTQMDLSYNLLQHGLAGQRVCANALQLPVKDEVYDKVVVQGGFHHLEGLEAFRHCLQEISRVLKKGCQLLFCESYLTRRLSCVLWALETPLVYLHPQAPAVRRMVRMEGETYRHWLEHWNSYKKIVQELFEIEKEQHSWNTIFMSCRKIL